MSVRVDKLSLKKYLWVMSLRLTLMGAGFFVTALWVDAMTPDTVKTRHADTNHEAAAVAGQKQNRHLSAFAFAETVDSKTGGATRSYRKLNQAPRPIRHYPQISTDTIAIPVRANADKFELSKKTSRETASPLILSNPLLLENAFILGNPSIVNNSDILNKAPVQVAELVKMPTPAIPIIEPIIEPVMDTGSLLPVPKLKTPAPIIRHSVDLKTIDNRIKALMLKKRMVGLSVGIVENGELTFAKGYGETLKGSGSRVTKDTVFRWASVSKGVAAATLMTLADEGQLSLDNPVEGFATSLILPKNKYKVTIADLLAHRVGIVRNAYDRRIEEGRDPDTIRASMQYLKPFCEPGTCHSYQNVIFDSASEIAESVTGLPYKAVVSERLFKPLNMNTASLTYEGLVRSKNWAKPHTRIGRPIRRVKPNYYRVPAAAGVNSSVVDLSKWMIAQMGMSNTLETEATLSKVARDEMQKPRINTPREARIMRRKYNKLQNPQYGLGWRIYDYGGHKVVGHRGGVEGYRALVLFDPEIKSGVAVMWNSSHSDPIGLQLEVMDQIYGHRKRDWMRLSQR